MPKYNKVICKPIIDQFIVATWGEWGQFSSCSATCGAGNKSRDRVCENGVNCDATTEGAQETEACEDKICPPGNHTFNFGSELVKKGNFSRDLFFISLFSFDVRLTGNHQLTI